MTRRAWIRDRRLTRAEPPPRRACDGATWWSAHGPFAPGRHDLAALVTRRRLLLAAPLPLLALGAGLLAFAGPVDRRPMEPPSGLDAPAVAVPAGPELAEAALALGDGGGADAPLAGSRGGAAAPALAPGLLARQAEEYEARRPKGILELQKHRRTTTIPIAGAAGREGTAMLVDLNPRIAQSYVLEVRWSDGEQFQLHLENARPDEQTVRLDPASPGGLLLARAGESRLCELWSERAAGRLREIDRDRSPYTSLCGGELLVRRRTRGAQTARERAAEFLRDNVPGGERLTVLVRKTVYANANLERAELATQRSPAEPPGAEDAPAAARVDEGQDAPLLPGDLGIEIAGDGRLAVGRWYPAVGEPGLFVSAITPGRVAGDIRAGDRELARELDAQEREALVYLVSFDLERFDLGFLLGTDHPELGWSARVVGSVRDPGLPGPDGVAALAPFQPTGLAPPHVAERVVATFVGGFKRHHGAFRHGALARVNAGSHYGFVEGGVVLSKLQPGLATLLVLDDGRVEMRSWSPADDALLERVRFARQNGVAVVERDPATGQVRPGPLVARWGEGNWGGSQDSKLRTVRGGACLQTSSGRRHLIYAYFSGATPSAMARVFQAYDCDYAMLLDMNALEHTYMARYRRAVDGRLEVEHLVRGMHVLDKEADGRPVPRFTGFADNRDFFYVARKRAPAAAPAPVKTAAVLAACAP